MCWNAPSTFKLVRFARLRLHAATILTTIPTRAVINTNGPDTAGGSMSRCTDS